MFKILHIILMCINKVISLSLFDCHSEHLHDFHCVSRWSGSSSLLYIKISILINYKTIKTIVNRM